MKRKICILLVFLMCFSVLTIGCNDKVEEKTPDTTTNTTTETTLSTGDNLEDVDMNGMEIVFLNYTDKAHYYSLKTITAEQSGDMLNDAFYKRNLYVEDRFKCKIIENQIGNVVDYYQKSTLAGEADDAFDIAMVYDAHVNQLYTSNCLNTWDIMTYCDLTKPWWNADANDCFSFNGKQFAAVGDYSLSMYSKSYNYYFNKQMYSQIYTGNEIYAMVRNGDWTIENMLKIGTEFHAELGSTTQYGIAGTTKVNYQMLISGAGVKFVDTDSDGSPYFSLSSNTLAIEKLSKINESFANTNCYYNNNSNSPNGGIVDTDYNSGTVFMLASTLWNIKDYKDNLFASGILPSPKYDKDQDSYYSVTVGGVVSTIPKIINDDKIENISIILEAMAYYSLNNIVPIYKEEILQARYADAPDDSDMLKIIFDSQFYDLGVSVWAKEIRYPLMTNVFNTNGTNLVSYIKAISDSVNITIKKSVEVN